MFNSHSLHSHILRSPCLHIRSHHSRSLLHSPCHNLHSLHIRHIRSHGRSPCRNLHSLLHSPCRSLHSQGHSRSLRSPCRIHHSRDGNHRTHERKCKQQQQPGREALTSA